MHSLIWGHRHANHYGPVRICQFKLGYRYKWYEINSQTGPLETMTDDSDTLGL